MTLMHSATDSLNSASVVEFVCCQIRRIAESRPSWSCSPEEESAVARGRREATRAEEASCCEWQTLPTVGSIRFAALSGCAWVASASGQTVLVVGFDWCSEVSCELRGTSNKPRKQLFWELYIPPSSMTCIPNPCLLTKFERCVLHPSSPPPKLPCSTPGEAQSRPHISELRTHRQLEHQEARITIT